MAVLGLLVGPDVVVLFFLLLSLFRLGRSVGQDLAVFDGADEFGYSLGFVFGGDESALGFWGGAQGHLFLYAGEVGNQVLLEFVLVITFIWIKQAMLVG